MATKVMLAVACCLSLSGCATKMLAASQRDCTKFGFTPGSELYASCVQDRYEGKQLALKGMLANMGNSLRDSAAANSAPAGTSEITTPGGFTKICTYNTITGPRAITVSSTALCPLFLPQ